MTARADNPKSYAKNPAAGTLLDAALAEVLAAVDDGAQVALDVGLAPQNPNLTLWRTR